MSLFFPHSFSPLLLPHDHIPTSILFHLIRDENGLRKSKPHPPPMSLNSRPPSINSASITILLVFCFLTSWPLGPPSTFLYFGKKEKRQISAESVVAFYASFFSFFFPFFCIDPLQVEFTCESSVEIDMACTLVKVPWSDLFLIWLRVSMR